MGQLSRSNVNPPISTIRNLVMIEKGRLYCSSEMKKMEEMCSPDVKISEEEVIVRDDVD